MLSIPPKELQMLKAKITDISLFENFLSIINKFVQQCQFSLTTEKVSVYCKNPNDFASSRLLLDSNILKLNEGQKYDKVSICIRDVIAFKSAISIVRTIEDVKEIEVQLDDIQNGDNVVIRSIRYRSKNGGSFNLITIDFDVIKNFVSKDSTASLQKDWEFNVNPKNLDIIQNKTGNIVSMDEVSVYIYPKNGKAIIELTSKKSAAVNSIALPLADSYTGSLDNASFNEIAIHESSFRIFNILRVTEQKDIDCFFNIANNVFFISSELNDGESYIKARLFIQMVKGK